MGTFLICANRTQSVFCWIMPQSKWYLQSDNSNFNETGENNIVCESICNNEGTHYTWTQGSATLCLHLSFTGDNCTCTSTLLLLMPANNMDILIPRTSRLCFTHTCIKWCLTHAYKRYVLCIYIRKHVSSRPLISHRIGLNSDTCALTECMPVCWPLLISLWWLHVKASILCSL